MECPVCLEVYDLGDHRPKTIIPCGHAICVGCVQDPEMGNQCPLDRKQFTIDVADFPDSFAILDILNNKSANRTYYWCRECGRHSTNDCMEARHSLCTLRQKRLEDAEPLLERLEQRAETVDQVCEQLEGCLEHADLARQAVREGQRAAVHAEDRLRTAAEQGSAVAISKATDAAERLLDEDRFRLEHAGALLAAADGGVLEVTLRARGGRTWRARLPLQGPQGAQVQQAQQDEAPAAQQGGSQRVARALLMQLNMDGVIEEVNALPDALLLRIFGLIEDGATLLDGVSLVCRRWLRLARDPRAWAGVRVFVPACDHSARSRVEHDRNNRPLRDAARMILRAPALRTVSLRHYVDCVCADERRVLPALLRSEAQLQILSGLDCATRSSDTVLQLLRRLAPHLVGLQLKNAGQRHLQVVADEMPALRRLHLDTCALRGPDTPQLPQLLHELELATVSGSLLESIEYMPYLRSLAVLNCSARDSFTVHPDARLEAFCTSLHRGSVRHQLGGEGCASLRRLSLVFAYFDGVDGESARFPCAMLNEKVGELNRDGLDSLERLSFVHLPILTPPPRPDAEQADDGDVGGALRHDEAACRLSLRRWRDFLRGRFDFVERCEVQCAQCDGQGGLSEDGDRDDDLPSALLWSPEPAAAAAARNL